MYHPQSNPAERVMRELSRMFRTRNSWPQYVPYNEWTFNNVCHESTHHAPSELFLNQAPHNLLIQYIHFPTIDILIDYDKKTNISPCNSVKNAIKI